MYLGMYMYVRFIHHQVQIYQFHHITPCVCIFQSNVLLEVHTYIHECAHRDDLIYTYFPPRRAGNSGADGVCMTELLLSS